MGGIPTKECFLLFSQRCISRETAGRLHFMLHKGLSVTTVKTVSCHNALPHILEDELTCGSCQLYIWQKKSKTQIAF